MNVGVSEKGLTERMVFATRFSRFRALKGWLCIRVGE
jgi:hypothetical protein